VVASGGIDPYDQEVCTRIDATIQPVMTGNIMDLKRDVASLLYNRVTQQHTHLCGLTITQLHKNEGSTQFGNVPS